MKRKYPMLRGSRNILDNIAGRRINSPEDSGVNVTGRWTKVFL